MRKFILVLLIIFFINIVIIYSNTAYGDKEPTGAILDHFKPGKANDWGGMYFEGWEERQDIAIIVHVIGDNLTDAFSRKSYGKSLKELDKETRQKGFIFWLDEKHKNPVLLISAVNINKIREKLINNNEFINALNKMWELGEKGFKGIDKDITEKKQKYKVNSLKEGPVFTLYYGNKEDLENRVGGQSLGGSSHLIYYKNTNKEYFLTSVKFIGKYNGDPDKIFHIIIRDINCKPIFMSEGYKFKEFSNYSFKMKEFPINLSEVIDEFYIEVYTDSSKENGLFIAGMPSGICYSYKLTGANEKDEELKNENWCIFPEFEKDNNNDKVVNYIPEPALNEEYVVNQLKSKRYPFLIYEQKGLKYEDLISKTVEITKKIEKIKIGTTNNIELLNILGKPTVIEIEKKNLNRTYCYIYGHYIFDFTNNLLNGYGVANMASPFVYGERIKIGSSIEDVFDLVGKPKKIITGVKLPDEKSIEDQIFYKDLDGREGVHSYSIDKLGIRFIFWYNKVSVIWQYKTENNEEMKFKIEYKENINLNSVPFIFKNRNIFHLSSKTLNESFWDIFELKLYQIELYGFGNPYFFILNREVEMSKYFSVFNYIESNENQYKFYDIIKLFFDISKEEIDNQVSEKTSLIFYKERKGKEPILLLAAYDEENMKKVYQSLKNKTTISEGLYILSHQELDK